MKIAQSYLSTIVRADMNIIQMRLFVIVARRCRMLIKGEKYTNLMRHIVNANSLNMEFVVPFKDLLGKSHNYASLYVSLASVVDKWKIQYWDADKRVWYYSSWVNNIVADNKNGMVRFTCPKWIADYMLDFSRGGFREYTFEKAMSLSNPNAARLYLITSSQSKPFTYSLDSFKAILGLKDRYRNFSQFEKRVLIPAKRELEKKACNGFKYIINRQGGKHGTPLSITLIPDKREVSLTDVESMKSLAEEVPGVLSQYLIQKFSFSNYELSHIRATLKAFSELPRYEEKFFEICERTKRLRKNHGYLINALRGEVQKNKDG